MVFMEMIVKNAAITANLRYINTAIQKMGIAYKVVNLVGKVIAVKQVSYFQHIYSFFLLLKALCVFIYNNSYNISMKYF
jgi:hypothetical protein